MASGESRWISGEASRADVQRWRARSGALMTGAGTVLADDPQLTVRLLADEPFLPPLRVVLDPGLATVARDVVRNGDAPTLYLHAGDAKLPRAVGIEHQAVPAIDGRLDLHAVLAVLGQRGINEVQLEAGATLAGAFLSAELVDELLLYVAPVLLGERARPLFHGLQIDAMAQRLQLRQVDCRNVGDDLRVLLRPGSGSA
jgi:diaminohydroxyphosphoribosylaminopyrimidine deaminase/5-amino-6-(5-phosphoribosylamino)uracil reductase